MSKNVGFHVSGHIQIPDGAQPVFNLAGQVCAYLLEDGRMVKPWMTLEVYTPETDTYEDVQGFDAMEALGFTGLEYNQNYFTKK